MGLQKKTVDALGGLGSTTLSTDDLSLEVVEGPHKGKKLHLDKEVSRIGRMDWCELSLPDDPWISNVHCECWLEEKGLRVHDLNSRNGIKLNHVPVVDAYFLPGTQLYVGQSVIQLRSHQQKMELSIPYHDESGTLVGKSLAMRKIFHFIPRLGLRKVTTLLTGETGTGKTSIAHAIHLNHHKASAPFVVVNCGALPESLINAALFGHEKGAFTGADKRHIGFFEQAHGGTLFLDEIAELSLELQPKLLDVLERRVIRRLGSEVEHAVDFHLITATHRNLKEACAAGRFREDLYFRLSVVHLVVPALRERKEDIPLLVEAILKELNPSQSLYVTSGLMQKLKEYLWPGNIRELRNVLERSLVFHEGETLDEQDVELSPELSPTVFSVVPSPKLPTDLPANLSWMGSVFPTLPLAAHQPPASLKDILKETERFFISQALQEADLNAPEAANLLGLSESWLYSRIKLYGLVSRRKK